METDSGQASGTAVPGGGEEWFGHPRGLSTLFFTEMWERFSYYGMRALLVLFMTAPLVGDNAGFGFADGKATAIYGLYTFFVYVLSLPGGWVADNIWGQKKAVFVGGCIIALGHFTIASPLVGLPLQPTFFLGLFFIVIGTGLLKPNVSSVVGDLYPEGGARRDAGFTIFYMGINIGAILGPTFCSLLGEKVDWHLGFSLAGIGMVLGLIQYKMGVRHLANAGDLNTGETADVVSAREKKFYMISAASVALIALFSFLMSRGAIGLTLPQLAGILGVSVALLAVLFFAYLINGTKWILPVVLLAAGGLALATVFLDSASFVEKEARASLLEDATAERLAELKAEMELQVATGELSELPSDEELGELIDFKALADGVSQSAVVERMTEPEIRSAGMTAFYLFSYQIGIGIAILGFVLFNVVRFLMPAVEVSVEKQRLFVIFWLFILAALFWSGFEQAGSSFNLFAERLTNRVVFGWEVPTGWLQNINPIFIVIMAPVFASMWIRLARMKRNPSIPVKFGLGLLGLAAGFFVLSWGSANATPENPLSPAWLIVTYFLHTCGELCLSPVGLSSMTKLAPPNRVSQMMGIWFVAAALGNLFAGLIAGQIEHLPESQLFFTVALVVGGGGLFALMVAPPIRKLMHGID